MASARGVREERVWLQQGQVLWLWLGQEGCGFSKGRRGMALARAGVMALARAGGGVASARAGIMALAKVGGGVASARVEWVWLQQG